MREQQVNVCVNTFPVSEKAKEEAIGRRVQGRVDEKPDIFCVNRFTSIKQSIITEEKTLDGVRWSGVGWSRDGVGWVEMERERERERLCFGQMFDFQRASSKNPEFLNSTKNKVPVISFPLSFVLTLLILILHRSLSLLGTSITWLFPSFLWFGNS